MVALELGNLSVVSCIARSPSLRRARGARPTVLAARSVIAPYRFGGMTGVRAIPAASCAATKETIGGRMIEAKRNACLVYLPQNEALQSP